MGFFATMIQGYKIMGSEIKLGWQRHGAQILTNSGTGLMLIFSALMAKKGSSQDVQQAIAEANAAIDEIQKAPLVISDGHTEKQAKRKRTYRLAKAKAHKFLSVGKHFWKEAIGEAVGAGMVMGGQAMHIDQKDKLAAGAGLLAAEFAAYRANVRADQGDAKDLEYLTTKRVSKDGKSDKKDGNVTESDANATYSDGGDVTVKVDPNAFKFWFSPETCPSLYTDNLDMTISNLKWVEDNLTRMGRMNGHLYLNDMRREFGGLKPQSMDHPLGGIFGRLFDRNDPNGCKHIDLGWRSDTDFCEGRKIGVWIIFPCDPDPIISKVNQKLKAIESSVV